MPFIITWQGGLSTIFIFFSSSHYLSKSSNYIITIIITILFIDINVMDVLEKSSGGEFQVISEISRFRNVCRTYTASELELFVILVAFGPLYVTESSILGAVRVLHVFRHFIIIFIIIVIIVVVITIITNIISITFIIIRSLGFLIKNSLLFL